jgi:hypothetical protein
MKRMAAELAELGSNGQPGGLTRGKSAILSLKKLKFNFCRKNSRIWVFSFIAFS